LKTKKRSNEEENSIANMHQNSVQLLNAVPPVPAQLERAVLPSMVSETASRPQLNQEPIESQHLNAQHYGAFTYFIRFAFIHLNKF